MENKEMMSLNDDELEAVTGGVNKTNKKAGTLLMKGSAGKASSAVFKGDKKTAGDLVDRDNSIDGKLILGDFNDKGTYC